MNNPSLLPPPAHVHFMGVGGIGVSGLAHILLARGYRVSGCDLTLGRLTDELAARGATIYQGHDPAHLDEVDLLVTSAAVRPDEPEYAAALARGIPTVKRAALLGLLLRPFCTIGVAGTHGKTTTSALVAAVLLDAGLDPTAFIGGEVPALGGAARDGQGHWAVAEADEYDRSFLRLTPAVAVVTNVEADHLENHGDLEGIFAAFEMFVDRIDGDGLLLTCADDEGAARIADYARAAGRRVRTYGTDDAADVRVRDIRSGADAVEFTVVGDAASGIGERRVRVGALIGMHMALNATAALVLAAHLGLDLDTAVASWANFGGVHRRFESHGEGGGVRVYDDYAHHPTEIAASLSAARGALAGHARLIAVFQPGTYSRTQTFAREFAQSLAKADIAVVMDIFPAREEPIPGVTGATISDLVELAPGQVIYEPRYDAVPERIADIARPGDLVWTMGIGNVYLLCDAIREACAARLGGRT